jgi:hypothetical protein
MASGRVRTYVRPSWPTRSTRRRAADRHRDRSWRPGLPDGATRSAGAATGSAQRADSTGIGAGSEDHDRHPDPPPEGCSTRRAVRERAARAPGAAMGRGEPHEYGAHPAAAAASMRRVSHAHPLVDRRRTTGRRRPRCDCRKRTLLVIPEVPTTNSTASRTGAQPVQPSARGRALAAQYEQRPPTSDPATPVASVTQHRHHAPPVSVITVITMIHRYASDELTPFSYGSRPASGGRRGSHPELRALVRRAACSTGRRERYYVEPKRLAELGTWRRARSPGRRGNGPSTRSRPKASAPCRRGRRRRSGSRRSAARPCGAS